MITRFLTEVRTSFNPFAPRAKVARNFLAMLPPNARQDMQVHVKMLPRNGGDKCTLAIKFSMIPPIAGLMNRLDG